jgi:hypothetical protein
LYEERRRIGIWVCLWRDIDRPGHFKVEVSHWKVITLNGRLRFYPGDVPSQVWAITIDRGGVRWFEAEITKITACNVMVRYRDEIARLDRGQLFRWWAWWRGVRFVSSRTGRIAAALDEAWWEKFGTTGAPPARQMPLEQARQLLGVPQDYTKDDVVRAFRRAALKAHPEGAPRKCFGCWSRPATASWRRSEPVRPRRSRPSTRRKAQLSSIGPAGLRGRALVREGCASDKCYHQPRTSKQVT